MRRTTQFQVLLVCLSLMPCNQAEDASQTSAAFNVVVIGSVNDSVSAISDALDRNMPRISEYLGITLMPHFVVKVWEDPAEFRSAFEGDSGRHGVTRGYVNTEKREVRLLDGEGVESVAVREATHLAILQLNPTIAANPFWLWESAALYLDGSEAPDTRQITCITPNGAPSLTELSTPPTAIKVYRIGYLVVRYIVATWGREALVDLIKNNGDIEASLGVSRSQFERNMHANFLTSYEFIEKTGRMSRSALNKQFSGNTLTSQETGHSTFFASKGGLYFGRAGVVQFEGLWTASDSNEICLELGAGGSRCSSLYQESASEFLLESSADCVLQRWVLTKGNSEKFAR